MCCFAASVRPLCSSFSSCSPAAAHTSTPSWTQQSYCLAGAPAHLTCLRQVSRCTTGIHAGWNSSGCQQHAARRGLLQTFLRGTKSCARSCYHLHQHASYCGKGWPAGSGRLGMQIALQNILLGTACIKGLHAVFCSATWQSYTIACRLQPQGPPQRQPLHE
jgi:hypothetical protein